MKGTFQLSLACLAALTLLASFDNTSATAGTITLKFNDVGLITFLDPGSPEAAAGFLLGERLILEGTFNDATPDIEAASGDGNFDDPLGFLRLTGKTSGATLFYGGGVEIEVDDDTEFEIESLVTDATSAIPNIIAGDIDLDTGGPSFFSNPDLLTNVVADLLASPFPNADVGAGLTKFWDGSSSRDGMTFGPAASLVTVTSGVIPEPTSLAIFSIGALGLVATRRRRNGNAG